MTILMMRALDIAAGNCGFVAAGYNVVCKGANHSRVMVYASTLRALASRGLATLCLSTEGGMAAELTPYGFSVAKPTASR